MNRKVLLGFLLVCTMISCSEDEVSKVEKNSQLLAGSRGKSKSWKLIHFMLNSTGYYAYDIYMNDFKDCTRDNIYTFHNNDNQEYDITEGVLECAYANPDTIESGNWFFDNNGKMVIILGYELSEFSQESGVFSYLPFPGEIVTLTDKALEIKVDAPSSRIYILKFVAI